MAEPFGRRETLERRIRLGNCAANGCAVGAIISVVGALDSASADVWLIAGVFFAAAAVTAVRFVTAMRIELFQLGRPGPALFFENDPPDEGDWN